MSSPAASDSVEIISAMPQMRQSEPSKTNITK